MTLLLIIINEDLFKEECVRMFRICSKEIFFFKKKEDVKQGKQKEQLEKNIIFLTQSKGYRKNCN